MRLKTLKEVLGTEYEPTPFFDMDFLVAYSKTKYSEPKELSNFRSIERIMRKLSPKQTIWHTAEYSKKDADDWIEVIFIKPQERKKIAKALKILKDLESHDVVDDEDYEESLIELHTVAYDAPDFIAFLEDLFDVNIEVFDDDSLEEYFWELKERSGVNFIYNEGSALLDIESIAEEAFPEEIKKLLLADVIDISGDKDRVDAIKKIRFDIPGQKLLFNKGRKMKKVDNRSETKWMALRGSKIIAGQKGYDVLSEGLVGASGEVKLANGELYHAILILDSDSSYELNGMWLLVVIDKKLREVEVFHDDIPVLGLTKEDIYPFKYKYYDTFSGDHHARGKGWI